MVARTKAFDTNEILHKAMNVFGNLGYEGTSLPDLIIGLGIARQSIYDTYGTKWELFFAAVRHYMDQKNQELKRHCEGPGTVVEKVELAFTTIIKVLMDHELRLQCFIISSAIEQALIMRNWPLICTRVSSCRSRSFTPCWNARWKRGK
ncbi:hypothetical protein HMSSN036_05040 [Paenibacillus macerans]|nr:hypothetical protein HMSSN036_05040 [Paenibacillus macerans]